MRSYLPTTDIAQYLREIKKFPLLEAEEESVLAKRWRENADPEAANRILTSHLRLVPNVARGYRGYGLPLSELVSEGNIGLMKAAKRFDPMKGARFSTYAIWWIKASIQEYILRSWSLVRIGSTSAQRTLFFKLRQTKNRIAALQEGEIRPDDTKLIAERLGVSERDVIEMDQRIEGDMSLNTSVRDDGQPNEWQDLLIDERPSQEEALTENDELEHRREALREALKTLSDRERYVLERRRLADEPLPLEVLSVEFGVSRERVRQIEARAFEKICRAARRGHSLLDGVAAKIAVPVRPSTHRRSRHQDWECRNAPSKSVSVPSLIAG
jgi:RNA polymerase sigma-32 factor